MTSSTLKRRLGEGGPEVEEPPTHYRTVEPIDDQGGGQTVGEVAWALVATLEGPIQESDSAERRRANESRGKSKYLVCEAFSLPRVAARARERGLDGGWSLDLAAKDPVTGRT